MIATSLLRCYEMYKTVMDADFNPLRHIPDPASRFWIMTVLAWMWCTASGLFLGSVIFIGASFVGHMALIFMVFFLLEGAEDLQRHVTSESLCKSQRHCYPRFLL